MCEEEDAGDEEERGEREAGEEEESASASGAVLERVHRGESVEDLGASICDRGGSVQFGSSEGATLLQVTGAFLKSDVFIL